MIMHSAIVVALVLFHTNVPEKRLSPVTKDVKIKLMSKGAHLCPLNLSAEEDHTPLDLEPHCARLQRL